LPVPAYAILEVSLDGGPWQTGGITATSGQSVQLRAEPNAAIGFKALRFTIWQYPEGFALPAGWTLGSSEEEGDFF